MTDQTAFHREQHLLRLLAKIRHPERLVVRSVPFGALVDNATGEVFTPPIADPDIAYGLCAAVKIAVATAEAVAAEREACLKAALGVCEDMRNEGENDMRWAKDRIDDAIRARSDSALGIT